MLVFHQIIVEMLISGLYMKAIPKRLSFNRIDNKSLFDLLELESNITYF